MTAKGTPAKAQWPRLSVRNAWPINANGKRCRAKQLGKRAGKARCTFKNSLTGHNQRHLFF
ncbi:hypothetical protein HMPREF1640_08150 [Prevotella sp. S7-1-8]|nr:hypothetical protein HMPREF1640_08150 [Prevotella sp. S7-1-8]